VDPASPAFDLLRVLALSLLLVFGGVGSASPAGATAVEEAVTATSTSTTTGVRRRQLVRRPDLLRRRRTTSGALRLRPAAGRATRGRSFPASVRGPPAR